MRLSYLIIFLLLTPYCFAQTKIGNRNTGIEPSAALELSAVDKALTLPYVPLTATDDLLTVPNPTKGMIVYSTLTGNKALGDKRIFADLKYFFNGTIWQLLVDKSALGNLGIPGVIALGKQDGVYSMNGINTYLVTFGKRDQAVNIDGSITAKKQGYYMYASRLVWKTSKTSANAPIFNNPASRVSFLFQNPTNNPTTNATSHPISYSGLVYLNAGDTSKGFSIAYGGAATNVGDINDAIEYAEVVWLYLGDILN